MTKSASQHSDALWIKAQMFLNRALDGDPNAPWDESMLWASLALELLGKSALSQISPMLVADVTADGQEILKASGLMEGKALDFKTVAASTVFKRCAKVFPAFNSDEALKIAQARNEYLHGAGIGFGRVPDDVWWQKYWALAHQLVIAQDRDLRDLLGTRAALAEAHLAQNSDRLVREWEGLRDAALRRLQRHESGTMNMREYDEWQRWRPDSSFFRRQYRESITCPACQGTGDLSGEDVIPGTEDVEYDYDEYDPSEVVSYTAEIISTNFCCSTCHISLHEELLEVAGVPTSFSSELDPMDYVEPEYGND